MRRRPLLASLGASIPGAVAGCLGALQSNDIASSCQDVELSGHSQYRYNACNSGYAAGIAGPSEEPELQRVYEGAGAPPLTTNGMLFSGPWSAEIGGGTRWEIDGSAAALYEDSVLGTGRQFDGFWAVSMEDGRDQWQVELSQPRSSEITVHGDHAYFSTVTGVLCVDLDAQEEAWNADLDAAVEHDVKNGQWEAPAATSEHVFALTTLSDDEDPDTLFALDPESGEVDWTVDLALEDGFFLTAGPFVADGFAFVTAHSHDSPDEAYAGRTRVIAVDLAARDVAWTQTLAGSNGSFIPAAAHGQFYVTHEGPPEETPRELAALDVEDGEIAWQTDHSVADGTITATDDTLFTAHGHRLRAYEPDTGEIQWEINLVELDAAPEWGDWYWLTIPVVHDGRIFAYLGDGTLVEFA